MYIFTPHNNLKQTKSSVSSSTYEKDVQSNPISVPHLSTINIGIKAGLAVNVIFLFGCIFIH
jgi:hypothetical protein